MTDEDLVPAVEFMRAEYGEHEKLLDVEERTELSLLMTKFAALRVREELEAAASELDQMAKAFMDDGESGYAGITQSCVEVIRKRISELAGSEEGSR